MSEQQASTTNYKEAFALFDKRGNGRVSLNQLGDLLRACGQNPTLSEIGDLEQGIGGDCECFVFPTPLHSEIRADHETTRIGHTRDKYG